MTSPIDTEALGEDVSLHTLMRTHTHADGRMCGYHSRLGKWATGWPMDQHCLREHPDPYSTPQRMTGDRVDVVREEIPTQAAHADPTFDPTQVKALVLDCDDYLYEANDDRSHSLVLHESGEDNYSVVLRGFGHTPKDDMLVASVLQNFVADANAEPLGSKIIRVTIEVVDA